MWKSNKCVAMLKDLLQNKRLILASNSPRRKELLSQIGLNFTVQVSDFPEDLNVCDFANFQDFVMETALCKAQDVFSKHQNTSGIIIIGADTIVLYNNQIYGKPKDFEHAVRMLSELSGKQHEVYTGVALVSDKHTEKFYQSSKVTLRKLTLDEIRNYVKTGEPMDKAGSYAIQGEGRKLIENITGDFSNVVGLPIQKLCDNLTKMLNKYD